MILLSAISKRFGTGVLALQDISLQILPKEILGVLGENGAGKSTLMNILFGLTRPTAGSIQIANKPVRLTSPRVAQSLGIGMVHQHFKLVPTLSVLDNLALFLPGKRSVLRQNAATMLAKLHWKLPVDHRVDELAVGQQQRVEILKALLMLDQAGESSAKTLILDEPTAVLTPQETAELFTALRALCAAGTAIVFISHKLAEVAELCDRIAILRRGRLVHEGSAADLSPAFMARLMVGESVALPQLARQATVPSGDAVLRLANISTAQLKAVTLSVLPGEIVGIAGVDGNGQADLARAILGALRISSGTIALNGTDAGRLSMQKRTDAIACIAEDRQREALVLPLTIRENLLLKDYRKPPYSTGGFVRPRKWRQHAAALMGQFDIRANSHAVTVGQLSGGNQQKVVLARELSGESKRLILAINPTRGLDVGATGFVMQKLLNARANGAGVLLIHSDLDELLAISDRVLVMYNGTLRDSAWPAAHITRQSIGAMMLGVA